MAHTSGLGAEQSGMRRKSAETDASSSRAWPSLDAVASVGKVNYRLHAGDSVREV